MAAFCCCWWFLAYRTAEGVKLHFQGLAVGGGGGSSSLPILNNAQYLQGLNTGAVAVNIIGIDANNLVSIDPSGVGSVLAGTVLVSSSSLPVTVALVGLAPKVVIRVSSVTPGLAVVRETANGLPAQIDFYKNRAGAAVNNGDTLANIRSWGLPTNLAYSNNQSADWKAVVDGAPGVGIVPTAQQFSTTSSAGVLSIAFALRATGNAEFGFLCVMKQYTVATLPTPQTYGRAFVTDALVPAFGSPVAGGGAVTVPVYYDGAAWIVG